MKIIVLEHPRVQSKIHFNDIANTPLWSCLIGGYAAAALEAAGHDTHFLDAASASDTFSGTRRQILDSNPDLLCVNAVYFWEHTFRFFDFLIQLRQGGFSGHINLIGFFPSLAYEIILHTCEAVDSVAVGECEGIVCELADTLQNRKDWQDIPGLACRSLTGVVPPVFRKPSSRPDEFAFPRRGPNLTETLSILGSRGCYNHCNFCPVPSFCNQGPLWRGRSPQNIVAEVRQLRQQGGRDFYFVDPNFVGPGKKGRSRAVAVAKLLKPLNITFGMETRPDDLDDDLLQCLRAAGLTSLLLGIESGSGAMLQRIRKGSSRNAGQNAIELCRKAGIEPEIGFIMFLPDSSLEDIQKNFNFLMGNRLLDRLERTTNLLSHYQIVLMGTSGYRFFADQGRLKPVGVLGFEALVDYRDVRVKWLADLMIPVCLAVLREMSRIESLINWQTAEDDCSRRLNVWLVDLFGQLLDQAARNGPLPDPAVLETEILMDFNYLTKT